MLRVVYILGAGFSCPLGLPLMKDFYDKSRELARNDESKYGYFAEVIGTIYGTHSAQNYFEYPRFNIEEALSILEMRENLGGKVNRERYERYIIDVIKGCTPDIPPQDFHPNYAEWKTEIFGREENWNWYGHFFASLVGLKLRLEKGKETGEAKKSLGLERIRDRNVEYSIVTLNYDAIPEKVCDYINHYTSRLAGEDIRFIDGEDKQVTSDGKASLPYLVKIHGCVNKGKIIPPTYIKGLYQKEMPVSWKVAYALLMKANEIRIVGYSLPSSDCYIKYLLKAAIGDSKQLDRIDIVCLNKGNENERYHQFISFDKFEFAPKSTENYLGYLYQLRGVELTDELITFDKLEKAHKEFMKNNRTSPS